MAWLVFVGFLVPLLLGLSGLGSCVFFPINRLCFLPFIDDLGTPPTWRLHSLGISRGPAQSPWYPSTAHGWQPTMDQQTGGSRHSWEPCPATQDWMPERQLMLIGTNRLNSFGLCRIKQCHDTETTALIHQIPVPLAEKSDTKRCDSHRTGSNPQWALVPLRGRSQRSPPQGRMSGAS